MAETMERLLGCCDALITTGGVSVGDKDIFHQALPLLGAETVFWRLNVKPGTPALYSTRRGKPILSLSGNPFAAAATFELLGPADAVRPAPGRSACCPSGGAPGWTLRSPRQVPAAVFSADAGRTAGQPAGGALLRTAGLSGGLQLPGGSSRPDRPLEPGRLVEVLLL